MTEKRRKLIARFQSAFDNNVRADILAAHCANIAEDYHEQQVNSVDLADVVGRSEQLSDFIHWIAENNMMESGKTFGEITQDYLIR